MELLFFLEALLKLSSNIKLRNFEMHLKMITTTLTSVLYTYFSARVYRVQVSIYKTT